jgi:hypothetical protein
MDYGYKEIANGRLLKVLAMSQEAVIPEFRLHFEGDVTRGHRVPAAALVKAIQGLQRSIQLLAFAYEGEGPGRRQRLRASYEMERKYAVVFGVPEEGGYVLPFHIGSPVEGIFPEDGGNAFERIGSPAQGLFVAGDIAVVTEKYENVLQAIQNGDQQAFRRAVSDASIRRRLVHELKAMQPPYRTGLVVSIEDFSNQKIFDGNTAVERLAPLLAEPSDLVILSRLVAGRLDGLDFQTHTLRLKLPTQRVLSGTYSEDFEPVLLENPREWIQVRGEATLDQDGNLYALHNITEIIEVDDSPISVAVLSVDERSYTVTKVTRPLEFAVTFDPVEGTYTAVGDFHMMVSGETRSELEAAVDDALRFLWREYVDSDQRNFSDDAKLLREQLLQTFSGGLHAIGASRS